MIRYRSETPVTISIITDSEASQHLLPETGGHPLGYYIRLTGTTEVSGIKVSEPDPSFAILEASLSPPFFGASIVEKGIEISEGISLSIHEGNPETIWDMKIRGGAKELLGISDQLKISIAYQYSPSDQQEPITLSASSHSGKREFYLHPAKGGGQVHLYTANIDLLPDTLSITAFDPGFTLESIQIAPISFAPEEEPLPIPADFGAILGYDPGFWRNERYELFSWNLFPKILVMDTKDYEVQSNFFHRLAFFVEKRGYAGFLHSDETIENQHSWNAHDYRAEDLARFYQKAAIENFPLDDEEMELFQILLANDIINIKDNLILPGDGGILSISQSSDAYLRNLFLTHEGYHGVYFGSADFREGVQRIWEEMAPVEQEFWRVFLDWRGYNADDPYLVVNEFQAYLLQQPVERVEAYYWDYTIPRMLRFRPESQEIIDILMAEYPETFLRYAENLENLVFGLFGIHPGKNLTLEEKK